MSHENHTSSPSQSEYRYTLDIEYLEILVSLVIEIAFTLSSAERVSFLKLEFQASWKQMLAVVISRKVTGQV